jgi:hypothetical protein
MTQPAGRTQLPEEGGSRVTTTEFILAAQALASAAMCGLIWFVQVVHYPLFTRTDTTHSPDYPEENQRRTAPVVIPPMLIEAATAAIIAVNPPPAIGRPAALAGLAMVAALWLSTLLVQMPLHARLKHDGHAPATVAVLVQSNWARTALWSARALLAIWMLHVAG